MNMRFCSLKECFVLNSGSIQASISAIRLSSASSTINVSSSVTGTASLSYYCMSDLTKFTDPGNKLQGEVLDCDNATLLTVGCANMTVLQSRPKAIQATQLTGTGYLVVLNNPIKETLSLRYQAAMDGAALVSVYLSNGMLLYREKIYCRKGDNRILIPKPLTTSKGMYLIEIINSRNEKMTARAVRS